MGIFDLIVVDDEGGLEERTPGTFPTAQTPAVRFERWLAKNRHVYELFKSYSAEVRAAGHKRFSAYAVANRMRWHMLVEAVQVPGDGGFKICNDFIPYLARYLVQQDESFRDFFEFRQLKQVE